MWTVMMREMRRRPRDSRQTGHRDDEEHQGLVSAKQRDGGSSSGGGGGSNGRAAAAHPHPPPPPPGAGTAAARAAAAAAAAAARAAVRARCRPQLAWAVAVVFALCPLLEHHARLPAAAWKAALAAALLVLAREVLRFRRWRDEYPYVARFALWFSVMIAELLWENVMVWIVSATDLRKYDDPPGLQDNGELVALWLEAATGGGGGGWGWRTVAAPLVAWAVRGRWANIMHFLGAVLALAFSVAWDQHPYSGFGVMARFSATIACSRLLRVASFMSTVLPSPRPGCYRRRFPPPPDTWRGILAVGVRQLRGFGGCNDLVFSGHGAFWTLGPLMFQTYYPRSRAALALLWVALAHTSLRDVVDRQHYSVDMILAVVVTWAVWDWLAWVYPPGEPLPARPAGSGSDEWPHPLVVALVVVGLVTPAVVVFVAKS